MKKIILRVDCDDEWEHLLVIDENNILLSDGLENHRLSATEILTELAKHNIINFILEEIK